MRWKTLRGACLVAMCSCAMAFGSGTWRWSGGGSGDGWTICDNWDAPVGNQAECYPSTTSDDVVFGFIGGPWVVELITEGVDDVTIYTDVDFGGGEINATLTADSLTIAATLFGGVTVRMNQGGGPFPYANASIRTAAPF